MSFDAADWPGEAGASEIEAAGWSPGTQPTPRVLEDVAVRRWVLARQVFAEAHGSDYVYTVIGGRCWRRLAFMDEIVIDPRERQHTWDEPV
jgi:hypothetical protein